MCWVRLGIVLAGAWLVLLFGPARAEAVPSVTFKCTPAPANCSGWFRSNVTVDWTVLPSGAAVTGCSDQTFIADTAGTTVYCSAEDEGVTVTVQRQISLDKTPPVVTGGQPSRGADVNGWYNRAVGISFSGSDQTSGIDFCTSTTYGGPDSASASVTGSCHDKAGNQSGGLGYGLRYDQTAPVLTGATPERAPNAGGWFNRPVRFDIQAGDAISGIADCPRSPTAVPTPRPPRSAAAAGTGRVTRPAASSRSSTTPPRRS